MNFEVGEKQARVVARAHACARADAGCGCAPSPLETPGWPGRWNGPEGRGGSCSWGRVRRPKPWAYAESPRKQLRWGLFSLLLLNLLAQSFLRFSPALLPANFPGPSDKPGGVEGSGEVKEA